MRVLAKILVVTLFVLGVSTASLAGQRWIDKREYHQQERIRQGIRSGELNRRETERLEAQEARIRVDERFARADGHISARERARLDRELDHASHDIYRQKHDGQLR